MDDTLIATKENLLQALHAHGITVTHNDGKLIHTEAGFCIELESPVLFKLSQEGYVIAPFDDVAEMCKMIKAG